MNIKHKAAIAAVMVYLEQEKKEVKASNWRKFGSSTIMRNRSILQSRGRYKY